MLRHVTAPDGVRYALEREYRDVAAVVRDAGGEAMLFGHSPWAAG